MSRLFSNNLVANTLKVPPPSDWIEYEMEKLCIVPCSRLTKCEWVFDF